jgi:DNA-binding Xre family transcriptional regulator
MRDGAQSQLDELRAQLREYEELRDGKVTVLEATSLDELPSALIRARIATNLTQKALAERLGVKEQQVQRYEATMYSGVTFDRVRAVADALDVRVNQRITLPPPAHRPSAGATDGPAAAGRST